jgi:hypothetical protein
VLPENHPKKTVIFLLVIFAFSCLFLFFNLGSYSLKEPDEGRYAEIPREMVEQGDYVVPRLDYVRYFEKPPLLYWVTAASYKMFGVSEWSFRFPNALVALLCVLATFFFASRRFGSKTGLLSSLILTTSFGFFALGRLVTTDMLFTFLLFAALLCFSEFYRDRKGLFLYLFYAALALAVLAKGPVALILLGATILLFLLLERRVSFVKEMASVTGIAVFAIIAVPWFVLICLREKEFFQFFFIDQHIMRFLTSKHKRSGPPYYFIPVLFGGLFPWSIFIPRAVVRAWRTPEMRLLLIWSLVVFAFFSVSGSKLPPYILPIFPALSVVLGSLFEKEWQKPLRLNGEIIVYGIFFLCLALGGFAYTGGMFDTYLGTAISDAAASLSGDIRGFSIAVSVVSLVILLVLVVRKTRTFRSLFFALSAFSVSVILGLMLHAHVIDRLNTTKELAQAINGIGEKDLIVVNYGSFDQTLPFYIQKRTYIAEYTGELKMGSRYEDTKDYFLDHDAFVRLFKSESPVVTVLKAKRLAHLKKSGIEDFRVILCQDKRCLIGNPSAVRNR